MEFSAFLFLFLSSSTISTSSMRKPRLRRKYRPRRRSLPGTTLSRILRLVEQVSTFRMERDLLRSCLTPPNSLNYLPTTWARSSSLNTVKTMSATAKTGFISHMKLYRHLPWKFNFVALACRVCFIQFSWSANTKYFSAKMKPLAWRSFNYFIFQVIWFKYLSFP